MFRVAVFEQVVGEDGSVSFRFVEKARNMKEAFEKASSYNSQSLDSTFVAKEFYISQNFSFNYLDDVRARNAL